MACADVERDKEVGGGGCRGRGGGEDGEVEVLLDQVQVSGPGWAGPVLVW